MRESRSNIPKKQKGSGVDVDMTDLPDNMTNEQIADMLVDQGIARMQSNPVEARHDFEHALALDAHEHTRATNPNRVISLNFVHHHTGPHLLIYQL